MSSGPSATSTAPTTAAVKTEPSPDVVTKVSQHPLHPRPDLPIASSHPVQPKQESSAKTETSLGEGDTVKPTTTPSKPRRPSSVQKSPRSPSNPSAGGFRWPQELHGSFTGDPVASMQRFAVFVDDFVDAFVDMDTEDIPLFGVKSETSSMMPLGWADLYEQSQVLMVTNGESSNRRTNTH